MAIKIIVTGANGQVGSEIRELAGQTSGIEAIFLSRDEFSLEAGAQIKDILREHQPQYLVNCAAYTAVDKAEAEKEISFTANAVAPGVIAAACKAEGVRFIHISTDYVFNGNAQQPYSETDHTEPVNYYGYTKLEGEKRVLAEDPEAIVIRTAWVYSVFGNNFVKTMLRLMKERDAINVVSDQFGTPTYAADLAAAIMQIITEGPWQGGIYHYSNQGVTNWYEFALAIRDLSKSVCTVNPIPTSAYPTPAKRPHYSVLDKTKIQNTFHLPVGEWKSSLSRFMERYKKVNP